MLLSFALPVFFTEISLESLFTPWSFQGVSDGCESTAALVFSRVLQEQCQGTVATHAVSSDTDSRGIDLIETGEDGLGQLFCYIAIHLVSFGPRFCSCVNVEAGTTSEVVGIIFSSNLQAPCDVLEACFCGVLKLLTRTGIRIQDRNSFLACTVLKESFLGAIIAGASQAGQVYQQWYLVSCVGCCLRWQI